MNFTHSHPKEIFIFHTLFLIRLSKDKVFSKRVNRRTKGKSKKQTETFRILNYFLTLYKKKKKINWNIPWTIGDMLKFTVKKILLVPPSLSLHERYALPTPHK